MSGTANPYTVTWTTVNAGFTEAVTNSGSVSCSSKSSSGTLTVISSITLPNGQSYHFDYDSATGLLSKITYPTGASVSYTWGTAAAADEATFNWTYGPGGFNSNSCDVALDAPAITDRYVSLDGSSNWVRHDHFTYSTGSNPWKTTTVDTTTNDGQSTRTV